MRIALGIEYDGSGFCGWQIQPHARSVQEDVQNALGKVADHPVSVVCAGRTDTGVHALEQVVHFDTTATRTPRAWTLGTNANLAHGVSVLWAQPVAEDFHARYAATARHYRYVILNRMVRPAIEFNRVSWYHRPLDVARMSAAAAPLIGEHDFTSFRALACQSLSPVREVRRLDVRCDGEHVIIDICANAFLHHMVRNIAGVLMAIGSGDREPGWTRELLDVRDRSVGGVTAPPQGLYLRSVDYPPHFNLPVIQRRVASGEWRVAWKIPHGHS